MENLSQPHDRKPFDREGCSACTVNGKGRCAPFASLGSEKCEHFPTCCNWCRITWCPNNRAKELYAGLHAADQVV